VALFARPLVVHALKLPVHLQDVTTIGLRIAAAGFVFRVAAGVMNSPQLVRLRMDLNALVTHGSTLLQIVLVPVVLFCGGGLKAAVTVAAIAALLGALAHTRVSMKLLPALRRPSFDKALLKPLARFGSGLVISSAAAVLLVGAEKAFLARFASVESLAYYAVACNLASLLAVVPGALANTALPAFSRLQASPDRTELAKLYSRTLRGTLLWIAPAGLLLCVLARWFFTIWAGPDYGLNSTPAFYIAVGGLILSILAYAPYCLLVSYGRSEIIARIHVTELIPYLPVAALLTWYFGIIGAAAAWSLRLAFDTALFVMFARRIAGFQASLFPTGRASYLAAAGCLLPPLVLNGAPAAVIATTTLAALAAYAAIVWIRVLQKEERALIASLLRKYVTGQVRTATIN
jgi:O-antigen/teichoic acid export membrane protein